MATLVNKFVLHVFRSLSFSFGCHYGVGTLPHSYSFYNHSCIRIAKSFPPVRYNADNDGDDDDEERPLSKRGWVVNNVICVFLGVQVKFELVKGNLSSEQVMLK